MQIKWRTIFRPGGVVLDDGGSDEGERKGSLVDRDREGAEEIWRLSRLFFFKKSPVFIGAIEKSKLDDLIEVCEKGNAERTENEDHRWCPWRIGNANWHTLLLRVHRDQVLFFKKVEANEGANDTRLFKKGRTLNCSWKTMTFHRRSGRNSSVSGRGN